MHFPQCALEFALGVPLPGTYCEPLPPFCFFYRCADLPRSPANRFFDGLDLNFRFSMCYDYKSQVYYTLCWQTSG